MHSICSMPYHILNTIILWILRSQHNWRCNTFRHSIEPFDFKPTESTQILYLAYVVGVRIVQICMMRGEKHVQIHQIYYFNVLTSRYSSIQPFHTFTSHWLAYTYMFMLMVFQRSCFLSCWLRWSVTHLKTAGWVIQNISLHWYHHTHNSFPLPPYWRHMTFWGVAVIVVNVILVAVFLVWILWRNAIGWWNTIMMMAL